MGSPQSFPPNAAASQGPGQPGPILELFAAPADPVEWFAWRLHQHRVSVDVRSIEGIRAAILESGLATCICGRGPDRRPEGYADCFARRFGEPLVAPARRARRRT